MSIDEREAHIRAQQECANPTNPLSCFRATIFTRLGGCKSFRNIRRIFKQFDTDGNGKINLEEFKEFVKNYNLSVKNADADYLFNAVDTDNSGTVDRDEFLVYIRGPMPERRLKIIHAAFNIMDQTGDGIITAEDLKLTYDVSEHPKFKSGEWSKEKVLSNFLNNFDQAGDQQGNMDGQITREEFEDYYAGVSSNIDSDAYFELMMRQAWHMNDQLLYEERKYKKAVAL